VPRSLPGPFFLAIAPLSTWKSQILTAITSFETRDLILPGEASGRGMERGEQGFFSV
jgi:hypothetical protein